MSKTPWTTYLERTDRQIGWIEASRGIPFKEEETAAWKDGYRQWPKILQHPPTLSMQMSQAMKRSLY